MYGHILFKDINTANSPNKILQMSGGSEEVGQFPEFCSVPLYFKKTSTQLVKFSQKVG